MRPRLASRACRIRSRCIKGEDGVRAVRDHVFPTGFSQLLGGERAASFFRQIVGGWIGTDQLAQCLAPPGQAGTDGADRYAKHGCDFLVAHTLKANEQDGRALFLGQFGDCSLKVAQLQPVALVWCSRQQRLVVVQPDRGSFAYRSPNIIDVLVVQYRKQPRAQVRPILPKMQFTKGSRKAVLYEIIGSADIARQGSRIAPQARDFGLDLPVGFRHDMLSSGGSARGADHMRRLYRGAVIRKCQPACFL